MIDCQDDYTDRCHCGKPCAPGSYECAACLHGELPGPGIDADAFRRGEAYTAAMLRRMARQQLDLARVLIERAEKHERRAER